MAHLATLVSTGSAIRGVDVVFEVVVSGKGWEEGLGDIRKRRPSTSWQVLETLGREARGGPQAGVERSHF